MKNEKCKIIELPVSRWKEYRSLRLESLKKEPSSFLASYKETLRYTPFDWKKKLEDSLSNKSLKLFFIESEGILVGMIGVAYLKESALAHSCTIVSFYIKDTFRGMGLGDTLIKHSLKYIQRLKKISRIEANVHEGKIASRKLLLRNGFKIVGISHKVVKINGKYYDSNRFEKIIKK